MVYGVNIMLGQFNSNIMIMIFDRPSNSGALIYILS
jgi:hypothetical protein